MNTLVVLFAGEMTGFALESFSGADSAFVKSLRAAAGMGESSRILLCAARHRHNGSAALDPEVLESACSNAGISVSMHVEDRWNAELLFSVADREAADAEQIVLVFGDSPLVDIPFSKKLMEQHCKHAAEYTFADGYPCGLSPDILARGILPPLTRLAAGSSGPVTHTVVFDTIKKDINSFDIETDIAPTDVRQLRMALFCDTWQNTLLCRSFPDITAENYAALVAERAGKLRTVPAFYGIQIAGGCPFACSFCPYPEQSRKTCGKEVTERTDTMSREQFSALADKIAAYSKTAVVSLSLWGEPSQHPDVAGLVADVLKHPGLSVLIETTGIGWTTETLNRIKKTVSESTGRNSPFPPIIWIVSLDAVEPGLYGSLRGIGDEHAAGSLFAEAQSCIGNLATRFPDDVWPQFIRMNENEEELEPFYRKWKETLSRVIVQKHDSFCGLMSDRRVADLSPLKRTPCWHLKRDMSILIDGTVPLCREALLATESFGNACTDDLSSIWNGYHSVYEQHTACVYEGICGACDEYYTYNF